MKSKKIRIFSRKNQRRILEIYKENGVSANSLADLAEIHDFLSKMTEKMAGMFLECKEKLILKEDHITEKILDYTERNYGSFFNKAIGSYQYYRDLELKDSKASLERDNSTIFVQENNDWDLNSLYFRKFTNVGGTKGKSLENLMEKSWKKIRGEWKLKELLDICRNWMAWQFRDDGENLA